MAEIRVYLQPRFPSASDQSAFYDFSKHIEFDSLEWEQNDQGTSSTMRANTFSILPPTQTHWLSYPGATQADKIRAALDDTFFHLKVPSRTEIQIRDVSTSPHTIIWGGIVSRVDENRDGGAIVGSIEATDYTELLNEAVALEYTPAASSTVRQTILSQTYSFTVTQAQRISGAVTLTMTGSIALGTPYSRNLMTGDTLVVNLSDSTYNGVRTITSVKPSGTSYLVTYQSYSNVEDSALASVSGGFGDGSGAKIYGFLTTYNAPGLDSRVRAQSVNIADLNPSFTYSPKGTGQIRNVQSVSRISGSDLATITFTAIHPFATAQRVTVALTGALAGSDINGTWDIDSAPTSGSIIIKTNATTAVSGAATGSVSGDGIVTPSPLKGGTIRSNLANAAGKVAGNFYLNQGTLDGSGALTLDLYLKSKTNIDLVRNGLLEGKPITAITSNGTTVTYTCINSFAVGETVTITGVNPSAYNLTGVTIASATSTQFTVTNAATGVYVSGGNALVGWSSGSYTWDSVGNTGPYSAGSTLSFSGTTHVDAEFGASSRVSVSPGEKYFISWRQKSDKVNKSHPHVKYYDSGGSVVGNSHGYDICLKDIPDEEWGRNYGIAIVPSGVAKMTVVLHHEAFSASYYSYFTDIQIIKITGAFGFSDKPITDAAAWSAVTGGTVDLRDFENPSSPSESGDAANRIYIYAPYTSEDPLTGAKQITNYRNTYDFVQGVWESGGKRIEASQVSTDATTSELALLTAQDFFKKRGQVLRSFEFEHISGPLNVGDVVPFIWNDLGIAEALIVRKQSGYMVGSQPYYKVQLGGDISLQRNTMYLVEQRLAEITGKTTVINPIPSPEPGTATAGGILTPTVPSVTAGTGFVALQWNYPTSLLNSSSFGGFIILRSADAGNTWYKVSTQEVIQAAKNPTAPDATITEYGDSLVSTSEQYTYKIAAVDVSGNDPIITQYSSVSPQVQPNVYPGGTNITDPYTGIGVNVPKVVYSVTDGGTSFYITDPGAGGILTDLPQTQYPAGQHVYAVSDGKMYAANSSNTWQRAAIDRIDVGVDGAVAIAADRIRAGNLDAGYINVTNLNVSSLKAGDIELLGNPDNSDPDRLSKINFKNTDGTVVSYWDKNGLVVKAPSDDQKKVYIHDGKIDLINSEGTTTAALDGNGINATSITVGQLPGGSNSIPNSSFELAGFGIPVVANVYGPRAASPLQSYSSSGVALSFANMTTAVSGAITAVSVSSPNVTYTCSPHSFAIGDYVTIIGVLNTGGSGTIILNLQHEKITAVSGTTSFTIQPGTTPSANIFPTGAVYASSTGKAYRDQIEQTTYGW